MHSTKLPTDFSEGGVGYLPGQIHSDLAWNYHCLRRVPMMKLLHRHAEEMRYRTLDFSDGTRPHLYVRIAHFKERRDYSPGRPTPRMVDMGNVDRSAFNSIPSTCHNISSASVIIMPGSK